MNQKSFTLRVSKCISDIAKVCAEKITPERILRISNKHKISPNHIKAVGGWLNKDWLKESKFQD